MKQVTAREFQQRFSEYRDSIENIEVVGREGLIGTWTPVGCIFTGVVKGYDPVKGEVLVAEGNKEVTCVKCNKCNSVGVFYEYDPGLGLVEDRELELCKKCSVGFIKKQ